MVVSFASDHTVQCCFTRRTGFEQGAGESAAMRGYSGRCVRRPANQPRYEGTRVGTCGRTLCCRHRHAGETVIAWEHS